MWSVAGGRTVDCPAVRIVSGARCQDKGGGWIDSANTTSQYHPHTTRHVSDVWQCLEWRVQYSEKVPNSVILEFIRHLRIFSNHTIICQWMFCRQESQFQVEKPTLNAPFVILSQKARAPCSRFCKFSNIPDMFALHNWPTELLSTRSGSKHQPLEEVSCWWADGSTESCRK